MKFYTLSDIIPYLQQVKEDYGDLPCLICTDNHDGTQLIGPLKSVTIYEPHESKGENWCLFCDESYPKDEDTK